MQFVNILSAYMQVKCFTKFFEVFMQYTQNIENELKKRKITAKKMLLDLGYADSLLSQWKKGSEPSAVKLNRIAEYLNVSTDYLLGNTDDPTPPKKEYTEHDRLNYEISKLSPENREKAAEYIEFLKTREDFEKNSKKALDTQPLKPQTE